MREDMVSLLYQFWSQTRSHSATMVSCSYSRLEHWLARPSWQLEARLWLLLVRQVKSVCLPTKLYCSVWSGWYIFTRHNISPYLQLRSVS